MYQHVLYSFTSSFILITLAVCKAELMHNSILKSSVLVVTFLTGRGKKMTLNIKDSEKTYTLALTGAISIHANEPVRYNIGSLEKKKHSRAMVSSGFINIFVAHTGNMMPTTLGLGCHWHMKQQD